MTKQTIRGSNGKDGLGGIAGANGRFGRNVITICSNDGGWKRIESFYVDRTEPKQMPNGCTGCIQSSEQPTGDVQPIYKVAFINQFKKFLIKQFKANSIDKSSIMSYYKYLRENDMINSMYTPLDFTNELNDLEETLFDRSDIALPIYNSMMRRLEKYADNKTVLASAENRKILKYLYTAVLSKISFIKSLSKADFIIDMGSYLKTVKENIADIRDNLKISDRMKSEQTKIDSINRQKKKYETDINEKIKEANYFITKEITPAVKSIEPKIQAKVEVLITDALAMQERAKKEKAQFEEMEKQMKKALIINAICGVVKTIGAGLAILGPQCAAVGAVFTAGAALGQSFAPNPDPSKVTTVTLPPSIGYDMEKINADFGFLGNQKVQELIAIIDDSIKAFSGDSNLVALVNNLAGLKKKITEDKNDPAQLLMYEEELNQEVDNALMKVKKRTKRSRSKREEKSKTMKNLEGAKKVLDAATAGFGVYSQFKKDSEKLDLISGSIKKADSKIQELVAYKKKVESQMFPMIKSTMGELNNVIQSINRKSQVVLDVTKWKVQGFLKDTKLEMMKFSKGFKSEEGLRLLIEKLDEAMTTMIIICDRIQTFQDQQNLGRYIADISSATVLNVKHSDPRLDASLIQLDISIRANIIMSQHKSVIKSFKQWVFPFAKHFLEPLKLNLPQSLAGTTENMFESFANESIRQIELIGTQYSDYKAKIVSHDKYLFHGHFDDAYKSSQPFYIWKNETHSDEIARLLSGEKIVVKAEIQGSNSNMEAIKFSQVNFNFKSSNDSQTEEINEKLKAFRITANHLGNSYFSFNQKTYVISSEKQSIQFALELDKADFPTFTNNVYDKLYYADLLLSPYAMWEISLNSTHAQADFNELKKFKNQVDFRMVGWGSFLIKSEGYSDYSVDENYEDVRSQLLG